MRPWPRLYDPCRGLVIHIHVPDFCCFFFFCLLMIVNIIINGWCRVYAWSVQHSVSDNLVYYIGPRICVTMKYVVRPSACPYVVLLSIVYYLAVFSVAPYNVNNISGENTWKKKFWNRKRVLKSKQQKKIFRQVLNFMQQSSPASECTRILFLSHDGIELQ